MTSLLLSLVLACGAEDWAQKTLTDGAPLIRATNWTWTVGGLRAAQNASPGLHAIGTVDAYVLGFKLESDGDFHVVISDTPAGPTMIAEFPDPQCAKDSPNLAEMTKARADFVAISGEPKAKFRRLKTPARVRLTGAVYFDHPHGQLGGAPNSVELHPVLSVKTIPGAPANPPLGRPE